MMQSFIKRVWLLLLIGLLPACGSEPEVQVKTLRPVLYEAVQYEGGARVRTFSGTAQTDKIVNLSFRTSGIITRFNLRVGQQVRRGELLAELDNVQARLAYEQALASLNSAASQMNTAKLGYERVRALYEKGSSSLSDFENAKNSYRTAQASHESAQRSVEIQQEQMRYGFIYAPESGIIAAVNSELDENVSPGQVVAVLNAGSDMEIALGLPESVINRLSSGMEVDVSFTSLPGESYLGRVTEISPSVDAATSTYPVRVTLEEQSEGIRSGMTANVSFEFGEEVAGGGLLVVPAKAVGEDAEGRFVFLIEEADGQAATVKKQHVQIGDLTTDGFQVVSGLSAGQKIATAGLQTLLNGQEVRLK